MRHPLRRSQCRSCSQGSGARPRSWPSPSWPRARLLLWMQEGQIGPPEAPGPFRGSRECCGCCGRKHRGLSRTETVGRRPGPRLPFCAQTEGRARLLTSYARPTERAGVAAQHRNTRRPGPRSGWLRCPGWPKTPRCRPRPASRRPPRTRQPSPAVRAAPGAAPHLRSGMPACSPGTRPCAASTPPPWRAAPRP